MATSKDEWNIKEDIGKPIKNALCIDLLRYAKGKSQAKARSKSE